MESHSIFARDYDTLSGTLGRWVVGQICKAPSFVDMEKLAQIEGFVVEDALNGGHEPLNRDIWWGFITKDEKRLQQVMDEHCNWSQIAPGLLDLMFAVGRFETMQSGLLKKLVRCRLNLNGFRCIEALKRAYNDNQIVLAKELIETCKAMDSLSVDELKGLLALSNEISLWDFVIGKLLDTPVDGDEVRELFNNAVARNMLPVSCRIIGHKMACKQLVEEDLSTFLSQLLANGTPDEGETFCGFLDSLPKERVSECLQISLQLNPNHPIVPFCVAKANVAFISSKLMEWLENDQIGDNFWYAVMKNHQLEDVHINDMFAHFQTTNNMQLSNFLLEHFTVTNVSLFEIRTFHFPGHTNDVEAMDIWYAESFEERFEKMQLNLYHILHHAASKGFWYCADSIIQTQALTMGDESVFGYWSNNVLKMSDFWRQFGAIYLRYFNHEQTCRFWANAQDDTVEKILFSHLESYAFRDMEMVKLAFSLCQRKNRFVGIAAHFRPDAVTLQEIEKGLLHLLEQDVSSKSQHKFLELAKPYWKSVDVRATIRDLFKLACQQKRWNLVQSIFQLFQIPDSTIGQCLVDILQHEHTGGLVDLSIVHDMMSHCSKFVNPPQMFKDRFQHICSYEEIQNVLKIMGTEPSKEFFAVFWANVKVNLESKIWGVGECRKIFEILPVSMFSTKMMIDLMLINDFALLETSVKLLRSQNAPDILVQACSDDPCSFLLRWAIQEHGFEDLGIPFIQGCVSGNLKSAVMNLPGQNMRDSFMKNLIELICEEENLEALQQINGNSDVKFDEKTTPYVEKAFKKLDVHKRLDAFRLFEFQLPQYLLQQLWKEILGKRSLISLLQFISEIQMLHHLFTDSLPQLVNDFTILYMKRKFRKANRILQHFPGLLRNSICMGDVCVFLAAQNDSPELHDLLSGVVSLVENASNNRVEEALRIAAAEHHWGKCNLLLPCVQDDDLILWCYQVIVLKTRSCESFLASARNVRPNLVSALFEWLCEKEKFGLARELFVLNIRPESICRGLELSLLCNPVSSHAFHLDEQMFNQVQTLVDDPLMGGKILYNLHLACQNFKWGIANVIFRRCTANITPKDLELMLEQVITSFGDLNFRNTDCREQFTQSLLGHPLLGEMSSQRVHMLLKLSVFSMRTTDGWQFVDRILRCCDASVTKETLPWLLPEARAGHVNLQYSSQMAVLAWLVRFLPNQEQREIVEWVIRKLRNEEMPVKQQIADFPFDWNQQEQIMSKVGRTNPDTVRSLYPHPGMGFDRFIRAEENTLKDALKSFRFEVVFQECHEILLVENLTQLNESQINRLYEVAYPDLDVGLFFCSYIRGFCNALPNKDQYYADVLLNCSSQRNEMHETIRRVLQPLCDREIHNIFAFLGKKFTLFCDVRGQLFGNSQTLALRNFESIGTDEKPVETTHVNKKPRNE